MQAAWINNAGTEVYKTVRVPLGERSGNVRAPVGENNPRIGSDVRMEDPEEQLLNPSLANIDPGVLISNIHLDGLNEAIDYILNTMTDPGAMPRGSCRGILVTASNRLTMSTAVATLVGGGDSEWW